MQSQLDFHARGQPPAACDGGSFALGDGPLDHIPDGACEPIQPGNGGDSVVLGAANGDFAVGAWPAQIGATWAIEVDNYTTYHFECEEFFQFDFRVDDDILGLIPIVSGTVNAAGTLIGATDQSNTEGTENPTDWKFTAATKVFALVNDGGTEVDAFTIIFTCP